MVSDFVVQAIRLSVFVGFFSFSAVCLILINRSGRERGEVIKKIFVVTLVTGLIVPILPITFPPFAGWQFFSSPAPESQTQYTVVVVDEVGHEFDYPHEAAPPGRVDHRGEQIATGTGIASPDEISEFLLRQANSHRQSLANGFSVREWIQYRSFPGVLGRDQWTPSEARQMGQLETIRVYQTTTNTSSDGLRIDSKKTELVYEYNRGETS
jgi:hypothetical protein